jgi:DNA-binding response OmpR family regulator
MADSKHKILIIEDELAVSRALELKLKHEGYVTKAVYDGEAGLAELQKAQYALILLDLVMPKVDGFKVLETLRERKSSTPVIVLTNLGQDEDADRAKALGATDYFVKSNTTLASIVNYVKRILK